jgi:hypothetical protein
MRRACRRLLLVPVAAGLVSTASNAWALDTKFHFKTGYDTGGDTLVTVVFDNGDQENIKANRGIFLGAGVSIVTDAKDIETELALSYKFDHVSASNGDVTWSRWPVDALLFYRWPAVRVGGGITYHLSPDLGGSGVASGLSSNFKNSLGYVVQADWRVNETMSLGLRYTILDYKLDGTNAKIDSNGVGIVFSGHL